MDKNERPLVDAGQGRTVESAMWDLKVVCWCLLGIAIIVGSMCWGRFIVWLGVRG